MPEENMESSELGRAGPGTRVSAFWNVRGLAISNTVEGEAQPGSLQTTGKPLPERVSCHWREFPGN